MVRKGLCLRPAELPRALLAHPPVNRVLPSTQLQGEALVGFPTLGQGVSHVTEMTVQERKQSWLLVRWALGNPADCGHHRRRSASSLCRLHGCWRRTPWPLQALGLSQQLPGALPRVRAERSSGVCGRLGLVTPRGGPSCLWSYCSAFVTRQFREPRALSLVSFPGTSLVERGTRGHDGLESHRLTLLFNFLLLR